MSYFYNQSGYNHIYTIMMMKKFQEWVLVLRDLSVCLELVDYFLVVLTSCNHSELQLSKKSQGFVESLYL